MNCVKGDMAVVKFDPPNPRAPKLRDMIVDVLERAPEFGLATMPDGGLADGTPDAWVVKFQRPFTFPTWGGSRSSLYHILPDYALRPIRDPGDDAVDEMVQKLGPALPVTKLEEETA